MSLKDIEYLTSYNKADHDIAEQFYLPSMRAAARYDRISGYFGSTIYIIAWDALKEFLPGPEVLVLYEGTYLDDVHALGFGDPHGCLNVLPMGEDIGYHHCPLSLGQCSGRGCETVGRMVGGVFDYGLLGLCRIVPHAHQFLTQSLGYCVCEVRAGGVYAYHHVEHLAVEHPVHVIGRLGEGLPVLHDRTDIDGGVDTALLYPDEVLHTDHSASTRRVVENPVSSKSSLHFVVSVCLAMTT